MSKRQDFENRNVDELIFPIDTYDVGAWTPERDGKGKCTQVHITLRGRGIERPFVVRIKSRERLDSFINLLKEYGDIVWTQELGTSTPTKK